MQVKPEQKLHPQPQLQSAHAAAAALKDTPYACPTSFF